MLIPLLLGVTPFVRLPDPVPDKPVACKTQDLQTVVGSALTMVAALPSTDPIGDVGRLKPLGVDRDDIRRTLAHIVASPPEALDDPGYWARGFTTIRWRPYSRDAEARGFDDPERLRVTKYLVYEVDGAAEPTVVHNTALYATPRDDGIRTQLSKQAVHQGAFAAAGTHAGMAETLIWLKRTHAEQALLQGTISVQTAKGHRRLFNVHRSNEMPWIPGTAQPDQRRFWYFREVPTIAGLERHGHRIELLPCVAVAGDVNQLPLGTVVALTGPTQTWITVLADTGGAFENNLAQLDLFAGTYPGREAFDVAVAEVPAYMEARILVVEE